MERKYTDDEIIRRVWDVLEIKNLMGRHAYFHAYDMHEAEICELWVSDESHQKTASFGQNWGYQVGIETIRSNYVDQNLAWHRAALSAICEKDSSVAHKSENLGIGTMLIHTLTTPYVEVAGDGRTAQGMWYSPGQVTVAGPDGVECMWMYERYGVDFIREQTGWKIWHMFIGTDFIVHPGTLMRDVPVPDEEASVSAPEGLDITIPMQAYSARHNFSEYPYIPQPYEVFDPKRGNGPEGNPAYKGYGAQTEGGTLQ
ncbi:MAG: nuclear transport factor 2 family protein [Clostridiales Family XIII bacterium]|jgi:hypothetical protein|nr:nuclear transport factor 2 family protein [Clostridiales Family XIII bacterium]